MCEPTCVGALIRNDRGRVFVQRRSVTRRVLPGIWDIVGGHIEAGGKTEKGLARGIKEKRGWGVDQIGGQNADWGGGQDGVVCREVDYLVSVCGGLCSPSVKGGGRETR